MAVNDDWVSIPVFTGPITSLERDGPEVTIEAQGKEALALAPHYAAKSFSLERLMRLDTAIRRLFTRIGETHFAIPQIVHGNGVPDRIPHRIAVHPETEPWKLLTGGQTDARGKKVPSLLSYGRKHYQAFYDGRGKLRVRRRNGGVVYVFELGGDNGTVIDHPTVTFDSLSDFRNCVRVTGAKTKGKTHHVSAFVQLHPNHPLSPQALSRNGKPTYIMEPVDAPGLKTTAACRDRAKEILKRKSKQGFTASFDSLPIPMLEESDRIALHTPDYRMEFEVQQFTIPLTSSAPMHVGFGKKRKRPKRRKIRRR